MMATNQNRLGKGEAPAIVDVYMRKVIQPVVCPA